MLNVMRFKGILMSIHIVEKEGIQSVAIDRIIIR